MKIIPTKVVFEKEEYTVLLNQIASLEQELKQAKTKNETFQTFIKKLEEVLEIHPVAFSTKQIVLSIDYTSDRKPILTGR